MAVTLPALASVFVIALTALLIHVARGRAARPGHRIPLVALWLCCALALGTIYGVQETLEGAGALAGGGWLGFALAFPAGLLVAVALRGADDAALPRASVLHQVRVVAAATTSRRPASVPRRLVELRLGARAPPSAFAR